MLYIFNSRCTLHVTSGKAKATPTFKTVIVTTTRFMQWRLNAKVPGTQKIRRASYSMYVSSSSRSSFLNLIYPCRFCALTRSPPPDQAVAKVGCPTNDRQQPDKGGDQEKYEATKSKGYIHSPSFRLRGMPIQRQEYLGSTDLTVW